MRATGRAARVTASLSPEDIKEVEVNHMNANSQVSSVKIDRSKFIMAVNQEITSEELLLHSEIQSPIDTRINRISRESNISGPTCGCRTTRYKERSYHDQCCQKHGPK